MLGRLSLLSLVIILMTSTAYAYHIGSLSDEFKANCRLYSDTDKGSEYKDILFNAYLCHHFKFLSDVEFSNVVENFVFHINAGNAEAVRNADMEASAFLERYFKDGTDTVLLSVGRKVLFALISYKGDQDGRYHFLLGLSYLNPKDTKDVSLALSNLKKSVDRNHPLAAAVVVHIYEGYVDGEVINKDLARKYRELFRDTSDIVGYRDDLESATSYIIKKGFL